MTTRLLAASRNDRQLGAGVFVSLIIHGVFAGALVLYGIYAMTDPEVRERVRLTFYNEPPPPPPPPVEEVAPEPAPTTPEPPRERVRRRIQVEEPAPTPTPAPAPVAAPSPLVQPETCSGAECANNPSEGDFGGGREARPGERGGGGTGTGHGVSSRPMMLAAGMSRPRVLSGSPPAYSAAARRARLEGTVVAMISIDATGHVTDVQIIRGITMLNELVLAAVRQQRYSPAIHRGQAVPVRFMQPFNFNLEN